MSERPLSPASHDDRGYGRELALLVALAAVVVLVGATADDGYTRRLLTLAGVYALLGLGYQLVFGHMGQLSLAQGAFYAVGAYAVALLMPAVGLAGALAAGVALAALLAAAVAIPVLRLQTHYFALATLGVAQVVHLAATNWTDLTEGANGLTVATPRAFGMVLPPWSTLALAWLAVAGAGWLSVRMVSGVPGWTRTLAREEPLAARALGVDVDGLRLQAFVLGAAFGGLAGGFGALAQGVVSPDAADLAVMVSCLTLVVVGGRRRPLGAALGALLVVGLPELFREFGGAYLIAFALATLGFVLLAPDGVMGLVARRWRRAEPDEEPSRPDDGVRTRRHGPTLQVEAVSKVFGGVQAVDGVSLVARAGEIVGLIGANGSGKSTLLNLIGGVERPDAGSVTVDGERIDGRRVEQLARAGVGRTFQTPQLAGDLSAAEHVAVARRTAGARTAIRAARIDWPAGDADALAPGVRRAVELEAALARAPSLLLLDEPTAGLDAQAAMRVAERVRTAAEAGVAVLLVEHDMEFLFGLADRVICLERGRVVAQGTPEEVRRDPAALAAYLGEDAT